MTTTAPSTWLDLPDDTGFGIGNLPYGVFSTPGTGPRTGIAIGHAVLDLAAATGNPVHSTGSLNAFMAQGPAAWRELRARLTEWLTDASHRNDIEPHLLPQADVRMHCRWRSPTTSTSTAPGTTRRTSAGCSVRTPRP